jgi:hypothetical protein
MPQRPSVRFEKLMDADHGCFDRPSSTPAGWLCVCAASQFTRAARASNARPEERQRGGSFPRLSCLPAIPHTQEALQARNLQARVLRLPDRRDREFAKVVCARCRAHWQRRHARRRCCPCACARARGSAFAVRPPGRATSRFRPLSCAARIHDAEGRQAAWAGRVRQGRPGRHRSTTRSSPRRCALSRESGSCLMRTARSRPSSRRSTLRSEALRSISTRG